MGRGCRARAAAWATVTLGARVPGVTAVGMTHLDGVGVVHVVIGVPTIVQSGPTRASRLWRESERCQQSSERARDNARERERDIMNIKTRETSACYEHGVVNIVWCLLVVGIGGREAGLQPSGMSWEARLCSGGAMSPLVHSFC